MQNFQARGAPPPDPRASGGWGLHPQTPIGLRQLGALPPDPKTAPHCEFLATRLHMCYCDLMLKDASIGKHCD